MRRRKAVGIMALLGAGGLLGWRMVRPERYLFGRDYTPSQEEDVLVDDLVDTLIPKTDTPGARECGVGGFVMDMLHRCTDRKTRFNFINGLREVEEEASSTYGRRFGQCSRSEREALLTAMEQAHVKLPLLVRKAGRRLVGDPFIATLKYYTVLGYCTSEPGATKALAYDAVPVDFVGTIALENGQPSWATH